MDIRSVLNTIKERGETVLIIGSGISGQAAASLLIRAGLKVTLTDRNVRSSLSSESERKFIELEGLGLKVEFGVDGEEITRLLKNIGLVILSPGVSLESQAVGAIKRSAIKIIGELEFALSLLSGELIAVTGSNGKSTTVSLIQHIFEVAGLKSKLCGNIGVAAVSMLEPSDLIESKQDQTKYVVEVSSYQLESSDQIRPRVGVWLNLSDNHLERHGSLDRYAACKAKLFKNQTESDLAILNSDDFWSRSVQSSARKAFIGSAERDKSNSKQTNSVVIYYDSSLKLDRIELFSPDNTTKQSFDLSSCALLGLHNRYNIAAALLVAQEFKISPELIKQALASFKPLEHRLEQIISDASQIIINDSKATTVAAALSAWNAITSRYPNSKIVLMLGGLAKAGSWDPLFSGILRNLKALRSVICFGQDASLLYNHCKLAEIPAKRQGTLKEGTELAKSIAQEGDIILLTPGCASFDEFKSFEERGRAFKQYVGG